MAQEQITTALPPAAGVLRRDRGFGGRFLHGSMRFARKRKLGAFGVLLVAVIMTLAVFAPVLQRYDETHQFRTANPEFNPLASPLEIARNPRLSTPETIDRYQRPNASHWFGTDQYGRDIYARVIAGAQIAVFIGIGASLIAVSAGTAIGVVSGYFGGAVDLITQRFVDSLQAFPSLVLLLLVVQVVNEPPLILTVAALGVLGWATVVRIIRSAVLAITQAPFVEAARSFGATDLRIMLQHVLPNVVAPIIVVFSIGIGAYILAEATLSFLGLGPADQTTWGKMVNSGRVAVDVHPWEALFAGFAITVTVLGFNLAGDAIRDELDPRLRGR